MCVSVYTCSQIICVSIAVQLLSHFNWRTSGFPALCYLTEFAQTNVHWVNDLIQPSHPHLPPLPLALNLSSIRDFSSELDLHIRWPKDLSFSFSISPFNEYSGLISFRIGWFDLLAVQGTLKSLLQRHSSKRSILQSQPSLWSNSRVHIWLLEKP